MSRIYEALKLSNESTPRTIVRVIDSQAGKFDGPLALDNTAEAGVAAPPFVPQADPSSLADVVPPKSLADVVLDRDQSLSVRPEFRTLPLQLRAETPALPFDDTDIAAAEQYRILRTNILQHPAQPKVVAISSSGSGDGKTITSINVAGILAMKPDTRVLLVESDLRRRNIAKLLGLPDTPGFSEVLLGQARLEEAIIRTSELPSLHVLPGGSPVTNPGELLESPTVGPVMTSLREMFSFIVVDTTPVGVVADFNLIQQHCDGVLMVIRPDHTDRSANQKALQGRVRDRLLGVIINDYHKWVFWKSRVDNAYYYGGGKARSLRSKKN